MDRRAVSVSGDESSAVIVCAERVDRWAGGMEESVLKRLVRSPSTRSKANRTKDKEHLSPTPHSSTLTSSSKSSTPLASTCLLSASAVRIFSSAAFCAFDVCSWKEKEKENKIDVSRKLHLQ